METTGVEVPAHIFRFVEESNLIEGIARPPTDAELAATNDFFHLREFSLADVVDLVKVYQPDARLRNRRGLNVRIGDHYPSEGGPHIEVQASQLVAQILTNQEHPFHLHCAYETLHPFTDGNGRSGRALWAWQMLHHGYTGLMLGFLHQWYYQSLQHSGGWGVTPL